MKILVCGNINSGKSYLVEKLKKIFSHYAVAQIDAFREIYGDGTIEKELIARNEFIQRVKQEENIIVELSGMGPLGEQLEATLPAKTFIIIHIDTDSQTCIERLKDKDFSLIPYPTYAEKLVDTIERIGKEFQNGEFYNLWVEKALQIIKVKNIDEIDSIPLRHYEKLEQIIQKLMSAAEVKEIVAYGSLGRNELTKLSDIDLAITTSLSLGQVIELIKKVPDITFIDTIENKIVIRFAEVLIELVVVQNQKESLWYYVNSMIRTALPTVIKGDKSLVNKLQKSIDNFSFEKDEIISQTIKRLVFFVQSLPNIAIKGDDYKFFFPVLS